MSVLFMQQGATVVTVAVPPLDRDDQDGPGNTLSLTAYLDKDGVSLRPPRATLLMSNRSAANADFLNAERLEMDRFKAFSTRAGRLPNRGSSPRFLLFQARAGETLALRSLTAWVSVVKAKSRVEAADTTSRTSRDGTKMVVPTVQVMVASDSGLNSSLITVGTDQGRFSTRHAVSSSLARGTSHHFQVMGLGRAGSAGPALKSLTVYVTVHKGRKQIEARSI